MTQPLAIDLFCGLGGWTEGLIAEGYYVVGFDIERHVYGNHQYPAQLVLQDVLTLHGRQFKDAALIVASPPCQEYSYMAMPWQRAKAKAKAIHDDVTGKEIERLNQLFNACFRIQREACEAAGCHIPMVVENVRGAIPWVGRSRYNYGSFHFWGDLPALMPVRSQSLGYKTQGLNWSDQNKRGQDFTRAGGRHAMAALEIDDSIKVGGDWFSDPNSPSGKFGSKPIGRKQASALIAKIPLPVSRHIARTYYP